MRRPSCSSPHSQRAPRIGCHGGSTLRNPWSMYFNPLLVGATTASRLYRTRTEKANLANIGRNVLTMAFRHQKMDVMVVFVSYSRLNASFANRLVHDLRRAGADPWQDVLSIKDDEEWEPALLKGVAKCDRFVLLASPESESSKYVRLELDEARRLDRPVLLVPIAGALRQLGEWQDRQMVPLGPYEDTLGAICERLGLQEPPGPATILSSPMTLSSLFGRLGGKRLNDACFAVRVATGPYGTAYLAGRPDAEIAPWSARGLPPAKVLLRFSGKSKDVTLEQVVEFECGHTAGAPWVIYIEGPETAKNGFNLPIRAPHYWSDSAEFCQGTILQWGKARHTSLDLFVQAPAALTFALGTRLKELIPFRVHHYFSAEAAYECVLRCPDIG